jgi:hypothetical protein
MLATGRPYFNYFQPAHVRNYFWRAEVTHPAQDWALALRSMRFNFGSDGERVTVCEAGEIW